MGDKVINCGCDSGARYVSYSHQATWLSQIPQYIQMHLNGHNYTCHYALLGTIRDRVNRKPLTGLNDQGVFTVTIEIWRDRGASVASGSMTDDQGTTGILSTLMSHSHQRLLNRLLVL
jgi:hypothetical protein